MIRRREFLKAGAALPLLATPGHASPAKSCILLMLVGGPSHLDTWDMKPDAPAHIRGPFRPIKTNVPGIEICEIFPRMARHADKFALIRSLHHEAAAVHDTGHQLMQTGQLAVGDDEHPHIGCVVAKETGSQHVVLPFPIGNTGGNMTHGQSAAWLGPQFEPQFLTSRTSICLQELASEFAVRKPSVFRAATVRESVRKLPQVSTGRVRASALPPGFCPARSPRHSPGEPEALRAAYGANHFGESCLMARRLVESGVRFVTVNMFETIFDEITWDSHGSKPFSSMADYRNHVGPMFDNAYSSLLEDLDHRGMLESTLVVGMGEFGRSPRINPAGGRDHWPQCWTIHMAGGGIKGGQVYGSSDATGAEPRDNPVAPPDVVATIYAAMGIAGPDVGGRAIGALFG
jgi:hypothetical protein